MMVKQYELPRVATLNITYLNTSVNTSDITTTGWIPPEPPYQQPVIILLAIMAGLVSICTTIGNIMVVISFAMEKSIRQPANYLIASLAITDIIIGSSSMPLYTAYLLKAYWPFDDMTCDLWLSMDYTVCLVSQYTVFLITLDRFCSVTVPARYRSWRTPTKMKVMIAVTWILPIMIFFSSILIWHHINAKARYPHECMALFLESALFSAILVICYYWVTLVVMIGLYIGIYKVALGLQKRSKETKKRIAKHSQNSKTTADAREKERLLMSSSEMTPRATPSTEPATSTEGGNAVAAKKPDELLSVMADKVAKLLIKEHENKNSPPPSNYLTLPDIKICPPKPNSIDNNNAEVSGGQQPIANGKHDLESPIWKPRSSLPNSSIHWDAFTGETYVKVEKDDTKDCKDDLAPDTCTSRSPSLSPKVTDGRHSKKRKKAKRNDSKSDYNDSSSETSESDNKPRVIDQLSSLVTSIVPASPSKPRKERKPMSSKKRNENRARKALRTITFILGAFVICWTPYHVIVLVASFCKSCVIPDKLYAFSYWLCYMNSPINPFCYALSNPQFKKSFISILNLTYARNCWKKLRGH